MILTTVRAGDSAPPACGWLEVTSPHLALAGTPSGIFSGDHEPAVSLSRRSWESVELVVVDIRVPGADGLTIGSRMVEGSEQFVAQVFINYRSRDQPLGAAMIDDALRRRFGSTNVYRDSQSIPVGGDVVQSIVDAVRSSDVLVAVIGRDWLAAGGDGKRLIDNPDDWVRREIAEAFRRGIPVIPVLVGDTPPIMTAGDLPPDIAGLAQMQFVRIRHRNAAQDLDTLVRAIAWMKPSVDLTPIPDGVDERSAVTTDEVAIYTSSNNGERVRDAVVEILEASGFERVVEGVPVSGSWFQRIFVRRTDASAVDKLAELMGKVERAAELKYIATPRAHNDEREATAISHLAEAMHDIDEVAIRTSSLIFLKTQGRVLSWVLTEDEIRILDARRDLMKSPRDIIDALPHLREIMASEIPDCLPGMPSKPELPPGLRE
jgi:hypothetical protein